MFNVIIAGVGGQGSILASHIFADAAIRAMVAAGKNDVKVRLGETFGAAMRGGAVASHVKIGKDVYNPLIPVDKADVVLGLEPLEALRTGVEYLARGGTAIINARKIEPVDVTTGQIEYPSLEDIKQALSSLGKEAIAFDATELAVKIGNVKVMNIIMLGVLAAQKKNPVAAVFFEEVIKERVPSATVAMNLKAFRAGLKISKETVNRL